jgi:KUP system potassium uptake protein
MMRYSKDTGKIQKASFAGLIITLGIVYGDIGTSPLYVLNAVGAGLYDINVNTILGSVSCIFWTLTLQTTVKYVIITLRADNKGEGGIFALFALIRKRYRWAYLLALIGGSMLLADGVITPAITVTSAVEGLHTKYPEIQVIPIVLIILTALFFFQQFGTSILGKSFGSVMLIWFTILAAFGIAQMVNFPGIFKAINPKYAVDLLTNHPGGFLLLGAIFLATTGAEALYSDLGHCGAANIRITWIFVKATLLLNYFGQATWMIHHPDFVELGINPFFAILPEWFLIPGIIIATLAAIIASQALISGSFTLVSEAISLNFWPKMIIKYPTEVKGQLFVPQVNIFLWIACMGIVLLFRSSLAMEAAYGLAITVTMLMTTSLLILFLLRSKVPVYLIVLLGAVYFTIEGTFLAANLTKFAHGGWVTMLISAGLAIIMYSWYNGRKIKNSLMTYTPVNQLLTVLKKVRKDHSIPKYASNLIYVTKADRKDEIESTIVYSLLNRQPKRADIYWFLHVDIKDEPYAFEYEVTHLEPRSIIKIDFYLGFRIEPKINLFFKQVLEDMSRCGEINIISAYPSLEEFSVLGDNRYILIDRILTAEHKFNIRERLIMNISDIIRLMAIPEAKSLHLDASSFMMEKVPLGKPDHLPVRIKRKGMGKKNHFLPCE